MPGSSTNAGKRHTSSTETPPRKTTPASPCSSPSIPATASVATEAAAPDAANRPSAPARAISTSTNHQHEIDQLHEQTNRHSRHIQPVNRLPGGMDVCRKDRNHWISSSVRAGKCERYAAAHPAHTAHE